MRRGATAVLTGSAQRPLLAAARSLARLGIEPVVVATGAGRTVKASRYVRHHLLAPDPDVRCDAYVDCVLTVARQVHARVVIPTDDASMLACANARSVIERDLPVAAAPTAAVRNVRDKRLNLSLARELGIPCAAQFELRDAGQLSELVRTLGLPLVMKNPGPAATGHRSSFPFRWLVVESERELSDQIATLCPVGEYPLFQELVSGRVHNVCCFAIGGEVVAAHEYVSIRRLQGSGVYRQIVPGRADLRSFAEVMLGALKWDGPAQLGFFVTEVGEIRYMETNGRFWGSIEGSTLAGWDFPRWTYELFADGARPTPGSLQIGSRTCWHCGDLQALAEYLAGGAPPAGRPGRTRAVVDYLTAFRPGIKAETFRLSDPLPAVAEYLDLVSRARRSRRGSVG
jgi:hypothetical protein